MSCAKTVTPIEMQSGMLSHGSSEHALHGNVDAPMGMGTFGVSGQLKRTVKHRILVVG